MGIELGSNFDMKTGLPLDSRFVVNDDTARNAIPSGIRYDGLLVYVKSTKKLWQLQGGITDDLWREAGGAGGSGKFSNIVTKTSGTHALDGTEDLVICDATSGNVVIDLAAMVISARVTLLRLDAVEANTVTINRAGADQILTELGLVNSVTLPYQGNKTQLDGISANLWGSF